MGIKLNRPDGRPLGNKGLFLLPIWGKEVVLCFSMVPVAAFATEVDNGGVL